MVDRVAEAICDAGAQPKHKLWRHFLEDAAGGDELAMEIVEQRRMEARLAIAAMREPTMEMLRATYEQRVAPDQPARQRKAIWQAMIDCALSSSVPATSDPSGLDLPDLG